MRSVCSAPHGEGGTPDVVLRGVTKRFGDLVAVDDIDLEVHPGEFLALLGPSGCGKTTTLRMIAGFDEPTEGEIEIGGRSAVGIPPNKRDVNTVFQAYALFPHMTVLDNVAYGLKQRKVGKEERYRQAGEALELVRLTGREQAKPAQLSGGMQQRVALARALVMNPKVLLLDEPLGALDQKLRKAMQVELKRIQRDVGITFIVVTHDQEEAMAMADRIAVMNAGPDRPARRALRDLRPPRDAVRGRLHRRHEPPRGHARARRRAARRARRRARASASAASCARPRSASACGSACGPRRSTPTRAARARRPRARPRWCSATTCRSSRCWRRARSSSPASAAPATRASSEHLARRQAVARLEPDRGAAARARERRGATPARPSRVELQA